LLGTTFRREVANRLEWPSLAESEGSGDIGAKNRQNKRRKILSSMSAARYNLIGD